MRELTITRIVVEDFYADDNILTLRLEGVCIDGLCGERVTLQHSILKSDLQNDNTIIDYVINYLVHVISRDADVIKWKDDAKETWWETATVKVAKETPSIKDFYATWDKAHIEWHSGDPSA